jgi:uncharacterized repeat protein (TIGR03809 family)
MPAGQIERRIAATARQWQDLAERRLAYFIELYRSGRWRHYYSEEKFALRMRDVIANTERWRELASAPADGPAVPDAGSAMRPAA